MMAKTLDNSENMRFLYARAERLAMREGYTAEERLKQIAEKVERELDADDGLLYQTVQERRAYLLGVLKRAREVQIEQAPWQPIATAPHDGTTIFVATSAWAAVSNHFCDNRWLTWHPPIIGDRPSRNNKAEDPTHWMSLPDLPSLCGARSPDCGASCTLSPHKGPHYDINKNLYWVNAVHRWAD